MAIASVNTNVSSLQGQRQINQVNNKIDTIQERLASGKKINSAKDDAAGLIISDRLTSQINGLNQAYNNASYGVGLAQTMEGGMSETSDMLQQMRDLAIQSANGIYSDADRAAINQQAQALRDEIDRVSNSTTYAGSKILAGDQGLFENGSVDFQVGANAGDTISMGSVDASFDSLAGGQNVDLSSSSGAQDAISTIDSALSNLDSTRGDLGAIQNRLDSTMRNQSNVMVNTADARSRISDTDYAEEASNYAQQSIIFKAVSSMLLQANTKPQLARSMLQ